MCRGTARRLPREDPRAEVGEDVRVADGVGPMEFQLNAHRIVLYTKLDAHRI